MHEDIIQENRMGGDHVSSLKRRGHGMTMKKHWRCRLCDHPVDPIPVQSTPADGAGDTVDGENNKALLTESQLALVNVPAAFRYLTFELACLNIQTWLGVKTFA